MKLLLIWFGNPVEYWLPLLGILLIAIAAYRFYGVINFKTALAGEKQKINASRLIREYPLPIFLLIAGFGLILIFGNH